MTQPPARIPEQPWHYPAAHAPAGAAGAARVGGYYTRGNAPTVPSSRSAPAPIWHGQRTKRNGKAIAAFVLAALGVCIVLFFTMLEAGFSETLVGAFIALIPLSVVLTAVWWLDRWEPEPRLYLFLSFAWGAGVATATAMYLNTKAFQWLTMAVGDPAVVELLGVGMVAPVIEEVLKGGALLAIVLWRSRLVNSAVDLVVYAATIASGFAFTENILYFARGSSAGVLGTVFFGRAIMSPFAHIMFTSATALVIAIVLYSRRVHLLWAFPLGTAVAIGLHSVWNISAAVAGQGFLAVFMWLHVPLFGAFVTIVLLLRRRERRNIITHLREYSAAGWFAPHEVDMLGSLPQRSRARSWAKNYGVRASSAMARFQTDATQLALNRQRMAHAVRKNEAEIPRLVHAEQRLLARVQADREQFLYAAGPSARAV
ncbi:MAG TPA: PrsW family intramembrane metalloprotease [Beutenbergiaceae bacterium]|nr:PrsW family intramembrane metalloprotease [Beutenbergiaceae bacterium]